jgi:hypothetical protein
MAANEQGGSVQVEGRPAVSSQIVASPKPKISSQAAWASE